MRLGPKITLNYSDITATELFFFSQCRLYYNIHFIITLYTLYHNKYWISIELGTIILFNTFYGIRNPFAWELLPRGASALMQIRCVSSSEIPLRTQRGSNEKS